MGSLIDWENSSPKEMKQMCTDLLKKRSPGLLDNLFQFYERHIDDEDPAKMKLAIEVGKTLINKALPNQTKVEVENSMKIPREFLEWKENQRRELENKQVKEAEYKVDE